MSEPTLCGLARSAALCTLAETLYDAWALMYDLTVPRWSDITATERHYFIARATDILDTMEPDPAPLPLFTLITNARKLVPFPEARHVR